MNRYRSRERDTEKIDDEFKHFEWLMNDRLVGTATDGTKMTERCKKLNLVLLIFRNLCC